MDRPTGATNANASFICGYDVSNRVTSVVNQTINQYSLGCSAPHSS